LLNIIFHSTNSISSPPTSFHTLGTYPLFHVKPQYSHYFKNILAETDGHLVRAEILKSQEHSDIHSHEDYTGISARLSGELLMVK